MRSIWTGTISFGLIHIPVNLYSATAGRQLSFKYLRKGDLCPISYVKVCRNDGKEVKYDDIVKGYEYQKGDFVILEDEDFKKADAEKTQTIEISEFVDRAEIDEKYYDKPYYLEPGKGANKAYVLLREALRRSNKVGIAKFVLRNKEHLAALEVNDEAIILNQMRFPEELRPKDELDIPYKADYSKKELDIAIQLIEQLSEHFEEDKYHDTYTDKLKKIIAKKAKGETVHVGKQKKIKVTEAPDIMETLRKSLEAARKKEKAKK